MPKILNMKKNKKSMLYSIFVVFTYLLLMLTAFIILDGKYKELSANKQIGERQIRLLEAYAEGEKAMFYIDRAAEIAAEEAVYVLAESGGLTGCGTFAGVGDDGNDPYVIWFKYGKDCFSESDLIKGFESFFNSRIYPYLSLYSKENVRFPYSFELSLQDSLNIVGVAKTDLIVGLEREGLYSISGECGNRILSVAQAELAKNIVEKPFGSNCGPAVQVYTAGACEEWCGDFVSWVYKEAGYPFDKSDIADKKWRIQYTPNLKKYFETHEQYIPKDSSDPEPGDVVFFWVKYKGRIGHVGIVESFDGEKLTTIEGNSGNRVKRNTYYIDNPSIVGFGRLKDCISSTTLELGEVA